MADLACSGSQVLADAVVHADVTLEAISGYLGVRAGHGPVVGSAGAA